MRGSEPGGGHVRQESSRHCRGQEKACCVIAPHHGAADVSDQHRVRGPAPRLVRPRVRNGLRLIRNQMLRIRWANPSPHQLDDCLEATVSPVTPAWQPTPSLPRTPHEEGTKPTHKDYVTGV
ncbi:hypothetical protein SLI_7986 [Streptomyces lividans 1326]|uniref:Uncharacterized protein n=1 Tax=Streptomyces lividans 1326 TaxID=1200984 RepID=A0A7U9DYV9_STRLI|nr:hypothetical protein SLI_7986 [Streptomyces lividans 1326]